jgi:hypothetical protein
MSIHPSQPGSHPVGSARRRIAISGGVALVFASWAVVAVVALLLRFAIR